MTGVRSDGSGRRVRACLGAFVAAVSALACGCSNSDGGSPATPRNLLFLTVDTLRADLLGVYGAEPGNTPAIDAFARDAVIFEHAVSHASWTLPSYATILTSQHTSTHGCWNFERRLSERFVTLPELFRDAGFLTAGIASHIFFDARYGLQQGFDTFDAELAHRKGEPGWLRVTSPQVTDRALRWLEARAAAEPAPWLLWLHYFDPHVPYVAHDLPPGAALPPEEERYRGEVAFTDRHVGRVLDALGANGFSADTVVVFVSDHGEAFEDHPGVRRHARSLYREELQVPLVIRVPGLEPRRVPTPVGTVDILPTLLALFDITTDQPLEGRSLLGAMRGEPLHPRPLLTELQLHEGHAARGLVEGRYKLIEDLSNQVTHLYDLADDPAEARNLALDRPEVVESLRNTMQTLLERSRTRARAYPDTHPVSLTTEDLEHLDALGYIDAP